MRYRRGWTLIHWLERGNRRDCWCEGRLNGGRSDSESDWKGLWRHLWDRAFELQGPLSTCLFTDLTKLESWNLFRCRACWNTSWLHHRHWRPRSWTHSGVSRPSLWETKRYWKTPHRRVVTDSSKPWSNHGSLGSQTRQYRSTKVLRIPRLHLLPRHWAILWRWRRPDLLPLSSIDTRQGLNQKKISSISFIPWCEGIP